MTVRVFQVPSPKHYVGRFGSPVIALVHHRMVGTLKSTDATFSKPYKDADGKVISRPASTNFGVGYDCGRTGHPSGLAGVHAHQYVMVDDAAWGNGNLDLTGSWDNVYGATPNPNFRTVSIEHHDNGGAAAGSGRKGVVPEEVLRVSIELDALLLGGDWAAWKAAGIRANSDAKGAAIAAQVRAIRPSSKTLIDHNYIAGKLKPYCWKPWADDRVGFPEARYIAALTAPAGVIDVPQLSRYIPGQVATVKTSANVRTAPQLSASVIRIVGTPPESWTVTGWTKGDVDPDGGSDQWLCRWFSGRWEYTAKSNVSAGPAVPPDTTPFSQAQLEAAAIAARRAEWDRQQAGATVALLPKP